MSAEELTTSLNNDEEAANKTGCKRKRNQISLFEYFSKRKKSQSQDSSDQLKLEMDPKDDNPEQRRKREMMASAAEKRLFADDASFSSCPVDRQSQEFDLSPSLFSDSSSSKSDALMDLNGSQWSDAIPIAYNRLPRCAEVLQKLQVEPDHTLLIRPHIQATEAPQPYPDVYRDSWDRDHVRMPCSKENLYPNKNNRIRKRWELIEETLLKRIYTSGDFQSAVMTYNVHYKDKWDFEGWHSFCNHYLTSKERDDLFETVLPRMVSLALRLPSLCTQPPPLLKRQKNRSLTMSQQQAACLLANAFFCTFPRRNSQKYSEYSTFPDINFNRLFRGTKDVVNKTKAEKLKTLLHYFKRVSTEMPLGTVTYTRQAIQRENSPAWESCDALFKNMHVCASGTIEGDGNGFLQVDFANRLVGGGVIGEGCVQEEIRFLICPEMILSRLFVERLDPNESLVIKGAERFSYYTGYAQTYKWQKPFIDLTPRDRWGRHYTAVVAVDAHVFHMYANQFKPAMLKRELNKAYCGFSNSQLDPTNLPAVATGNWGCGAFGGDARLKALIQLIAATVASRDIIYFTFGDHDLSEELQDFHAFLVENGISVGALWQLLQKYERELAKQDDHIELYPCLKRIHHDYNTDTDADETPPDETAQQAGHINQDSAFSESPGYAPGEAAAAGEVSPEYGNETP